MKKKQNNMNLKKNNKNNKNKIKNKIIILTTILYSLNKLFYLYIINNILYNINKTVIFIF
jgi:hypothetical protein